MWRASSACTLCRVLEHEIGERRRECYDARGDDAPFFFSGRRASPKPECVQSPPRVPVPEKCNMAMVASNMSGHIQKQLTRSLERILEEAHLSGELKLSGRKLKDFPKVGKTGAAKYNLQDTVIAGESVCCYLNSVFSVFSRSILRGIVVVRNIRGNYMCKGNACIYAIRAYAIDRILFVILLMEFCLLFMCASL